MNPSATETNAPSETAAARDARIAWRRQAGFGLFIHFGLYVIPLVELHVLNK